jgi:hypothetical protein
MQCKYCASSEIEYRPKPPHLGAYCKACGKFQQWVKHTDNPKTHEEYRDEYMDKQPATLDQIRLIQILARDLRPSAISKLRACKAIEVLKQNEF